MGESGETMAVGGQLVWDERKSRWLIGILLTLASGVIFAISTNQGIGVLPDTTRYMRLGPMSYDAPLYTWTLDALRSAGLPFDKGARSLGLFLVCANTLFIWVMALRGAGMLLPATAGTAVIILSPQFVGFHAVAMSEPLFLFILFLTVFAFLDYQRTRQPGWLLAAGGAFGLAMLARFSAAPMALVIAALLLFDRRQTMRKRFGEVALFAGVSGTIFLIWVVTSRLTTGQSIGRDFAFYGNAGPDRWLAGLETITAFLLPEQVPFAIRIALLVAAVGSIVWLLCRYVRRLAIPSIGWTADAIIPIIWGLFAALYVAFMVLAVNLEANLSINARYMLPFYIAAVISGTSLAGFEAREDRGKTLPWALAGLIALVLIGHIVRTAVRSKDAFANGIGYASTAWRSSPTVAAVRGLPADAVIFSNAPDALNFLTGRRTQFIPWKQHPRTGLPDPAAPVSKVLARMRAADMDGRDYVVFLDRVDWRHYQMTEPELVAALGLRLMDRETDGRIYTVARDGTR